MIRRPPRSTQSRSSAASDVYKRQDFCSVVGDKGECFFDPKASMFEAEFFPQARLNFAENILTNSDVLESDDALVFWGEDVVRQRLSWKELRDAVSQMAQALRELGVKKGDRVAAYMPNIPETIIAMLASSSIGAIWSSCSPDFGVQGVLDRFGQVEPTILIAADGYFYSCLLYTSPSPRDLSTSRMPSSA